MIRCSSFIRLLPISKPSVGFYDFEEYEQLAEAAQKLDATAYVVVLLGGDAGLRCGEIITLEWTDIDLRKRQSVCSGLTGMATSARRRAADCGMCR